MHYPSIFLDRRALTMESVEPTGEPMLISTSAPSEGDETLNMSGSGSGGSAKGNHMQLSHQAAGFFPNNNRNRGAHTAKLKHARTY